MDAWTDAMMRGDFAAAWEISDAVLRQKLAAGTLHDGTRPRHQQAIWDGDPLDGKRVLVRCYHGLGDTIQFVRLLPRLRARCASVILWAQPELLELMRACDGIDRLIPLHDGEPDIERDADIELMELPHALRLTIDSIPASVPYIRAQGMSGARHRGHRIPRVGLCWRAGEWNPDRSIPHGALRRLGGIPGLRWFSLQYPARPHPFPMFDLACRDLREFAQRLCQLDLIISVDTLTAHLAGALGLPVWLLLPKNCDWRWMRARNDSPWYPTMHLFRQCRTGEWNDVVGEFELALRRFVRDMPRRFAEENTKPPVAALEQRA
ncbi:MAG TPA: hypothetical protein VJ727_03080 [Rhodanobacteraceae bacterium]|nr:hypothetical protein [Rhodanobacteraceae bacterium]